MSSMTVAHTKRQTFLDVTKGIAIWCIVLLHYEQGLFPTVANNTIGLFMVPVFYIISGWLTEHSLKHYTLKAFVAKRWQQLGVPYLWWSAIILGFDLLLWLIGYYDLQHLGQDLYKTITLRGIGTLWFLPALFIGEVFWRYVWERQRWWMQMLIAVAIIAYNAYYIDITSQYTSTLARLIDAPFRTLSNATIASTYIGMGHLFYRHIWPHLAHRPKAPMALLGVLLYILVSLGKAHLPLPPMWNEALSYYLLGALSSWSVLLLIYSVQHWHLWTPLAYWGQQSLSLMVTHYSIVTPCFVLLITQGLGQTFEGWWALGCFLASIPLQYLLVRLIHRYLPQSLGLHQPAHV